MRGCGMPSVVPFNGQHFSKRSFLAVLWLRSTPWSGSARSLSLHARSAPCTLQVCLRPLHQDLGQLQLGLGFCLSGAHVDMHSATLVFKLG